jgi:hypothetical protein
MKWGLLRKEYLPEGIFGELTSECGTHFFFTLEHAYLIDGQITPKIQLGVHPCILYESPKHGYEVPLLNAPEDEGHFYEIHIGNYNKDSDGCILVGLALGFMKDGGRMLTSSKQAFKKLMDLGVEEIEVKSVSRNLN